MKLNIDENKKFLLIVGIALGMLFLLLGYDSSIRQNAQAMAKDLFRAGSTDRGGRNIRL